MKTETFQFHGLDCVARYCDFGCGLGHWCGYVAVPPSHPLWGKHYHDKVRAPKDRLEADVDFNRMSAIEIFCNASNPEGELTIAILFDVHGSLTYSDWTADNYPAFIPGAWWFGFDCAHAGDRENPKSLSFVINELKGLAKQLAEYTPEPPLAIAYQPTTEHQSS